MLLPNIPCSSGLDPEKSEIQLEIDEEGNQDWSLKRRVSYQIEGIEERGLYTQDLKVL